MPRAMPRKDQWSSRKICAARDRQEAEPPETWEQTGTRVAHPGAEATISRSGTHTGIVQGHGASRGSRHLLIGKVWPPPLGEGVAMGEGRVPAAAGITGAGRPTCGVCQGCELGLQDTAQWVHCSTCKFSCPAWGGERKLPAAILFKTRPSFQAQGRLKRWNQILKPASRACSLELLERNAC